MRTGPGTWDDHPTPFDVAVPGLAYDATTGDTLTISDDGAFGVDIWRWNGAFAMEASLAGDNNLNMAGSAHFGDGIVRLAHRTSDGELTYSQWDGAWSTQAIDTQANRTAIALNANEAPHIAYWTSEPGSWELRWAVPGVGIESITGLGGGVLTQLAHRITVVDDGGFGVPQVLAARQTPAGLHEIIHARRTGADAWDVQTVIAEDPALNDQCNFEPAFDGQQCDYDYIRLRPIDIVSSHGGDVRIFYAQDHHQGTLVATCMPGPGGGFCTWSPLVDDSEFELRMAWPAAAGGYDEQSLLPGHFVQSVDHAVDSAGTIHIAAHIGRGNPTVEYLQIGSSD